MFNNVGLPISLTGLGTITKCRVGTGLHLASWSGRVVSITRGSHIYINKVGNVSITMSSVVVPSLWTRQQFVSSSE